MIYATYQLMQDALTPAIVSIGTGSTPVWLQNRWDTGEYAFYIRRNGCGHCCAAMAANLQGVHINPYQEYELCGSLWSAPKELPDEKGQDHFQTATGISIILQKLGIPAKPFGVKEQGAKLATERILQALKRGKQVIFASDPDNYPDNPFSSGYHWVLAVGYYDQENILIANSSEKAARQGIQLVTPDIIEKALFENATVNKDLTWGELERLYEGCGYIVVG